MRRHLLRLLGAGAFTIPGLGGQQPPPQNAPGALTPAVGVQPGTSSTIRARQVIVSGSGEYVLVYNGTPAAGGLLASIAAAPFTDPYGNLVLGGTTTYSAGASPFAVNMAGGNITWYTASTQAGPWTEQAALFSISADALDINATSITGIISMPQAAPSDFPVSGSATLATTIAALNQLETLLVTAGVIA